MKRFVILAAVAASVSGIASANSDSALLDKILDSLASTGCFTANARFTVSMPQMPEDVVYELSLEASAAPADTLAPCDYLIDWRIVSDKSTATGFSAYADGNFYTYSEGRRLLEHHMEWDPAPFATVDEPGRYRPGVQRSAQFSSLLPQFMADDIRRWRKDPSYAFHATADTIVGGTRRAAIIMLRTIDGVTVQEGEYILDATTFLPVRTELENNPGSLTEQTVTAVYTPADAECRPINEERLAALYPRIFERYRESNFRIETLPGDYLPALSLPTLTGERYSRERTATFIAPAIFVIFDPADGFAAATVEAVRKAAAALPYTPQVVFAALSSNHDLIEAVVPGESPDERRLISAHGFARDCGVATPPVVIAVDRSGKVADVIVGYNKTIADDVIQKMSLLRP